jgi:lysozyme
MIRKQKGKLILISLGILLVIALIYPFNFIQPNNPDKFRYPVRGIDISRYQTHIDWKKLAQEDISFIYIKATEGVTRQDRMFENHWKNAVANKYHVGAYHFYLVCRPPEAQADNFIKHVPYRSDALPPVIDLEYEGSCWNKSIAEDKVDEIDIFLRKLEKYYRKTPIIYTNENIHNRFVKGTKLERYPVWITSLNKAPHLNNDKWLIWQYTFKGKVKGIKGHTDLNVFNGSLRELIRLCEGR